MDGNSGDAEAGEEATSADGTSPNEDEGARENWDATLDTTSSTEDRAIAESGSDGVVQQIVVAEKKGKQALIDGTSYIEKQFGNSWNSEESEQTGLKKDYSWVEKHDAGEKDLGPKVEEGGWM